MKNMKKISLFLILFFFCLISYAYSMVVFLPEACVKEGFDCNDMQCTSFQESTYPEAGLRIDFERVCENNKYVVVEVVLNYDNYSASLGGNTNGHVHAEAWLIKDPQTGNIYDDTFYIYIGGGQSVDYEYKPNNWVEVTSDSSHPLMWKFDGNSVTSYGVVDLQIGIQNWSIQNQYIILGIFF